MFINKTKEGNNICGAKITELRKAMKLSQKGLADVLQLNGLNVDKNAIQRIEARKRFVTDIELKALAVVFNIKVDDLLE